jgi:hypothetical protein
MGRASGNIILEVSQIENAFERMGGKMRNFGI